MTNELYPCLWFDTQAKAAAEFYCSVFPNSQITSENPMVVMFEINGRTVMGLNGGPHHPFTEAVSLVVTCDTQEELDDYWDKLLEGGREDQCGWLKDKFGLSWQIVPSVLSHLMRDPERAQAVMQALLQMKKLDIAQLQAAYDQSVPTAVDL